MKPSELREKQKELESKIESLEDRAKKLKSRRLDMGERFARHGAPCPECGSDKDPKATGWSYTAKATCKDCGFEGRCLD